IAAFDDHVPALSDEALALRFAEAHRDTVRYVPMWGQWWLWDGTRWARDERLTAFSLIRKLCREAARASNKAKQSFMLTSSKTYAAIERVARSDQQLAIGPREWNTDPWLLNTPAGTLELRSGEMRPHLASDLRNF